MIMFFENIAKHMDTVGQYQAIVTERSPVCRKARLLHESPSQGNEQKATSGLGSAARHEVAIDWPLTLSKNLQHRDADAACSKHAQEM